MQPQSKTTSFEQKRQKLLKPVRIYSWKVLVKKLRASNPKVKLHSPAMATDINWLKVHHSPHVSSQ